MKTRDYCDKIMELNITIDDDFTFEVVEDGEDNPDRVVQIKTEPEWNLEFSENEISLEHNNIHVKQEFELDLEDHYMIHDQFEDISNIKTELEEIECRENLLVKEENVSPPQSSRLSESITENSVPASVPQAAKQSNNPPQTTNCTKTSTALKDNNQGITKNVVHKRPLSKAKPPPQFKENQNNVPLDTKKPARTFRKPTDKRLNNRTKNFHFRNTKRQNWRRRSPFRFRNRPFCRPKYLVPFATAPDLSKFQIYTTILSALYQLLGQQSYQNQILADLPNVLGGNLKQGNIWGLPTCLTQPKSNFNFGGNNFQPLLDVLREIWGRLGQASCSSSGTNNLTFRMSFFDVCALFTNNC